MIHSGVSSRRRRSIALALAAAVAWALTLPAEGLAVGIVVNSLDDFHDFDPGDGSCTIDAQTATCSLRAAVEEANANGAASDTVSFESGLSGTILLTLGEIEITESIVIQGPGIDAVTVDADDASRHFTFSGESLELSGLTLTGGSETTLGLAGSLLVVSPADSVQLADLRLEGNHSDDGGAIGVAGGTPLTELILEGVELVDNTATQLGGAIALLADGASLHVADSLFDGNRALGGPSIVTAAGAIYFTVSGGAAVDIRTTTFVGNQALGASSFGGAVYLQNSSSGEITLTVDRSSFVGNSASASGAIYLADSVATFLNTTFGGNSAANGSAIQVLDGSDVTLASCTLAENGGGGAALLNGGGSTLSLGHTVISDALAACVGTPPVSLGYNLTSGNACSLGETGDLSNTDPLLGPLAEDGVPSPAYVPYSVSAAVDAGDPAGCPVPSLASLVSLTVDQWGQSRPWDGDGDTVATCDRGAIETRALLYDGFETGDTAGWSSTVP